MYDIAIIGAGAAGIACAKEAIGSGLKTLLVDKGEDAFGGVCLNCGCIPTKSLLNSSKLKISWSQAYNESKAIVNKIKKPTFNFLNTQGVDIVWGQANLLDKNTLFVDQNKIKANNIIIATGSSPKFIIDNSKVITAEELLNKPDLPEKILIIGAGYIGLEFASLLNSFGKQVLVIEKENTILPNFDSYLSRRLRSFLERKGIKIETGKDINDYNLDSFDLVVSAVGRKPNSSGLGLEKAGVSLDPAGWVKVDHQMKTNVGNLYACGDINGKRLLAYVAEYQARLCINSILGRSIEEDYQGVPECVFSVPSVAKVGILEDEAKAKGIQHKVIKSNFSKFSSAYVYNDSEGFIEVLVDEHSTIIGAGIISQSAGELISIFSLCIKNNLKLNDLKKCLFLHPTLSEITALFLN